MTTLVPRTSSTDFFDDEEEFDGAFDFSAALEMHLVGGDATWLDAPVAMIEEGAPPETIELDSYDIPIELEAPASDPTLARDLRSCNEPVREMPPAREIPAAREAPRARDVSPAREIPAAREVPRARDVSPARESIVVPADDSFTEWLQVLTATAESANVFVHREALRAFISEGRTPRAAFPSNASIALAEGNIARIEGEELVATAAFLRIAAEWRHVLAGEGGDFSKCGSRTFDEWSADFLGRILGIPARFDWFKRELRCRGVAAFGLVENAA